jgi:hypothetical protein
MKVRIFFIVLVMLAFWGMGWNSYNVLAIGLFTYYALQLYVNLTTRLAFREFILVLYGINYLLSPAVTYEVGVDLLQYQMKIDGEQYFSVILPAFLCLQAGLYLIPTRIFETDFSMVKIHAFLNEQMLKRWLIAGIVLYFARAYVPGEMGFFIYLLGLIRYVAAFALFYLNRKRYRLFLFLVLALEVYGAILKGMFHDSMMWVLFFLLFLGLIFKYNLKQKIIMAVATVVLFLFVQSIKSEYRNRIWTGGEEAGLTTFSNTTSDLESGDVFSEENLRGSLNRVNQAWIFASVVNNMDKTQDFQGITNVLLYAESALLPRFLAPNKLSSGDKAIFNKFSGHTINEGTSMGLGVFSDGYIAYGYSGVLIFAFCFGLLFGGVFRLVQNWTDISPFFVLFIFPILNYAVRPDCETQTTLGHIVKSVLVYGGMMWYYKGFFNKKITILSRLQRNKPTVKVHAR